MFYFPLVVSPYCINIYTLHYFLQSRYEIQTYRRIRGHRGSRSLNHGWLPHHPAFISTVTADSFKAVDLMSVVHFWVSEQRDTVLLWKGNREERPSLSDSHVKTRKQHGIPNFQTLTHAVCPHKEATGLTQHFVCKYSAVFFFYSWQNQCESISSLLSGSLPLLTVTWIRWCFSICVFTGQEAHWVSCKAWCEVCFIFYMMIHIRIQCS